MLRDPELRDGGGVGSRHALVLLTLATGAACAGELDTTSSAHAELPAEVDHLLPEERGALHLPSFPAPRGGGLPGATIVSRADGTPGESDLWLIPVDPEAPERRLFPGPGADERPTLLPDGRVTFVSTRSTVPSLWLGDLRTGALVQLTNRGLSAGRGLVGLVPPPHGPIAVDGGALSWDAGGGVRVELAVPPAREGRSP